MLERGFLIFLFFFKFFSKFLARFDYERNSGKKIFSRFLGLSHPILAKNNAGKRFLNFFAIFFAIFLPGSSMNGIRDYIFSLSFSADLIPFWIIIMPERGFLIFFAIFFGVFFPGRVWTEFGTKFFLLSFSAYLIPFWLKIILQRRYLIFWIFLLFFFGIFFPQSSMNGIRD